MKKISLSLLSLLFVSTALMAQTATNSVTGLVEEVATHQPVSFATVTLLRSADSSLVKGALTDTVGNYVFENIPEESYLVCVSVVGANKYFSEAFHLGAKQHYTAATISLNNKTATLKGATVTASKPLFEQKAGMLVVNVGGSISAAGNSVLDVLRKSPGVYADESGNISLKGKQGVMVLIDDKPTYLSADQLTALLKTTPANAVQQIEIMSNPPAKYDAAGSAGIINIKMKKNASYGFNGILTGTVKQWDYTSYNTGLTLNHRSKALNLYGTYNYDNYNSWVNSKLTRKFFGADTLHSVLTQDRFTLYPGAQHTYKTGADFYLNKRNTIGFTVNGMLNSETNNVTNKGFVHNQLDVPLSASDAAIDYNNDFNNMTYGLNYKKVFDTVGTSLAITADYANYNTSSDVVYHTDYQDINGNIAGPATIWRGAQPSVIEIKSGKIDFVHPFKNGINLGLGGKSSFVDSDNDMRFENYLNSEWVNDTGVTNHYIYSENINAAYIDLEKEFKKGWGVKAGLRGEQTIVSGKQLVNDSSFSRNYFQLFPTLFVKKDYGKQNQLSFSYSRRIDRPDYMSLNPFRFYVDPYTYKMGSPSLKPQVTNALNVSNIYKGFLTVSLDASRTSGAFGDILRQVDSLNLTIQYKENINTADNIGISISAPLSPFKWWQTTNFANVYYNQTSGMYLNEPFTNGLVSFEFNSNNVFVLPKGFSAELNGYYRTPMAWSIFHLASSGNVDAGVKKTFWERRASIKLAINDIFNTTHSQVNIDFSDLYLDVNHTWDSRTVNVSFTYVFGNTKVRTDKHRSGIEDEQGRVKKNTG